MVPLKYLSNFWRTLEMPLINSEVNLILTWSSTIVIIATNIPNRAAIFEITNTNNTISLSRHEQVCLMRLRFERYFSHHRDGRSISRNVASLNTLVHDVINLLYYEQ